MEKVFSILKWYEKLILQIVNKLQVIAIVNDSLYTCGHNFIDFSFLDLSIIDNCPVQT